METAKEKDRDKEKTMSTPSTSPATVDLTASPDSQVSLIHIIVVM